MAQIGSDKYNLSSSFLSSYISSRIILHEIYIRFGKIQSLWKLPDLLCPQNGFAIYVHSGCSLYYSGHWWRWWNGPTWRWISFTNSEECDVTVPINSSSDLFGSIRISSGIVGIVSGFLKTDFRIPYCLHFRSRTFGSDYLLQITSDPFENIWDRLGIVENLRLIVTSVPYSAFLGPFGMAISFGWCWIALGIVEIELESSKTYSQIPTSLSWDSVVIRKYL